MTTGWTAWITRTISGRCLSSSRWPTRQILFNTTFPRKSWERSLRLRIKLKTVNTSDRLLTRRSSFQTRSASSRLLKSDQQLRTHICRRDSLSRKWLWSHTAFQRNHLRKKPRMQKRKRRKNNRRSPLKTQKLVKLNKSQAKTHNQSQRAHSLPSRRWRPSKQLKSPQMRTRNRSIPQESTSQKELNRNQKTQRDSLAMKMMSFRQTPIIKR